MNGWDILGSVVRPLQVHVVMVYLPRIKIIITTTKNKYK